MVHRAVLGIPGVLTGCVAPPLSEVPVLGGTDDVRDAVRAELAAFDVSTTGGRAQVSRVVIAERDPGGAWNTLTHVVHLDDDLPVHGDDVEPSVAQVLRHELCHALDHREDLSGERRDAYAERGEALRAAGNLLGHVGPLQDETFAVYCSLGPWIARAAARPCADDGAPSSRDLLAHQSERVWTGATEPLPSTLEPQREARFDTGPSGFSALDEAWATSSVDRPDDLRLEWVDVDGRYGDAVVDSASGVPASDPSRRAFAEAAVPPPPDPLAVVDRGQAWPGAASTWSVTIPTFDEPGLRREVWSDGTSTFLLGDGCAQLGSFPQQDEAFVLAIDATQVLWTPLRAQP